MLHTTSAINSVQAHLALMPIDSTEAPQCIVKIIGLKDGSQRQRFVIGLGLLQVFQQPFPAAGAG
jgi:hypothetical protein